MRMLRFGVQRQIGGWAWQIVVFRGLGLDAVLGASRLHQG